MVSHKLLKLAVEYTNKDLHAKIEALEKDKEMVQSEKANMVSEVDSFKNTIQDLQAKIEALEKDKEIVQNQLDLIQIQFSDKVDESYFDSRLFSPSERSKHSSSSSVKYSLKKFKDNENFVLDLQNELELLKIECGWLKNLIKLNIDDLSLCSEDNSQFKSYFQESLAVHDSLLAVDTIHKSSSDSTESL